MEQEHFWELHWLWEGNRKQDLHQWVGHGVKSGRFVSVCDVFGVPMQQLRHCAKSLTTWGEQACFQLVYTAGTGWILSILLSSSVWQQTPASLKCRAMKYVQCILPRA